MTRPSPATSGTDVSDLEKVRAALEEARRHVYDVDVTELVQSISQALSALARLSLPAAWQGMDSAPKDGTWVLLFNPDYYEHEWNDFQGRYIGMMWVARWIPHTWANEPRGHWESYYSGIPPDGEPTHWQPLPPPPAKEPTP